MKDERERRYSGRKDKDTKIAVQAVSAAKESVDTTSLHNIGRCRSNKFGHRSIQCLDELCSVSLMFFSSFI